MSDLSLNPVYLSARSAIVAPERAVSTSLYSVQKWMPRLGPERWCLVTLLRSLCLDSPRHNNGTKQVVCSLQELAASLSIHKRTLLRWFKHEAMPENPPWRRLLPTDDKSQYLSLFIPRLRYAYETHNGKGKRVGLVIEILMEDPVIPEDEIRVKHHVELIQMRQSEMPFDTYRPSPDQNQAQTSQVKWPDVSSQPHVNGQNVFSLNNMKGHPATSENLAECKNDTLQTYNEQNIVAPHYVDRQTVTSPINNSPNNVRPIEDVNRHFDPLGSENGHHVTSETHLHPQNVTSAVAVNCQIDHLHHKPMSHKMADFESVNRHPDTLDFDKSGQNVILPPVNDQFVISKNGVNDQNDTLVVNVNQLVLLFKTINSNHVNPITSKIFEPIVELTEKLLEDNHSTGMLYKVLKVLHPNQSDIFVQAVKITLERAKTNPKINKGAVFVRTLREFAEIHGVDLGFKSKSQLKSQHSIPQSTQSTTPTQPQAPLHLPERQPISVEKTIWQQTKESLSQQMTKATYHSIVRDTVLLEQANSHYIVGVFSKAAHAWLVNRLVNLIQRTLSDVVGQPATVEFRLINETK